MPEFGHHHGSEDVDLWHGVLFGVNAAVAVIGALRLESVPRCRVAPGAELARVLPKSHCLRAAALRDSGASPSAGLEKVVRCLANRHRNPARRPTVDDDTYEPEPRPRGALVLILIYLVILAAFWINTYLRIWRS
jgi:hypothetical protein